MGPSLMECSSCRDSEASQVWMYFPSTRTHSQLGPIYGAPFFHVQLFLLSYDGCYGISIHTQIAQNIDLWSSKILRKSQFLITRHIFRNSPVDFLRQASKNDSRATAAQFSPFPSDVACWRSCIDYLIAIFEFDMFFGFVGKFRNFRVHLFSGFGNANGVLLLLLAETY